MKKKLTPRQAEVLETVQVLWRKHLRSPSLVEVAKQAGCCCKIAHGHLEALSDKGAVEWEKHRSRTIRPVGMRCRSMTGGFAISWGHEQNLQGGE